MRYRVFLDSMRFRMSEFRSSGKPTGKFDLLDHHGNRVSSETYRGLFTMIYFGFTNCRVVCPRTLAKLTLVLDLLGSVAQEIQPLYISVDPERDSPEAMRSYLGSYPHFTGLTGSPAEIDRAKQAFRVFTRRSDDPITGYAIPHSAITYVMDRQGAYVDHFLDSAPIDVIVGRLREIVAAA